MQGCWAGQGNDEEFLGFTANSSPVSRARFPLTRAMDSDHLQKIKCFIFIFEVRGENLLVQALSKGGW